MPSDGTCRYCECTTPQGVCRWCRYEGRADTSDGVVVDAIAAILLGVADLVALAARAVARRLRR